MHFLLPQNMYQPIRNAIILMQLQESSGGQAHLIGATL